jgi:predicted Zn-dependent peptidase
MSIQIGDTLLKYKTHKNDYYIITYIEDYEEYLNDILNKIHEGIMPHYIGTPPALRFANVCGNNAEFICENLKLDGIKLGKIIITDWVKPENVSKIDTIYGIYGSEVSTIGSSYHALVYLEVLDENNNTPKYYVAIETTCGEKYDLQFYVGSNKEDLNTIIKARYQCKGFKISFDCKKDWNQIANSHSGGKPKMSVLNDKTSKTLTLNNGIRVIIVPLKTNLTHISANFLLGHYQEKENELGMTHYYEHLLARMTSQKYKDTNYISEEIYKRGGISNAYVSDYEMCVYISGIYKDLDFYMDILSNTINKFYIDRNILEKERGAVIQEYMGYISAPDYKFKFNIFKFLYPKHSFIADYKKKIKYIEKFDYKAIDGYIKKHLNTNNFVITITCPLNKTAEAIKNVKKYFGVIKYKNVKPVYPVIKHSNTNIKIVNIKNDYRDDNNLIVIHIAKRIEFLSEEYLILNYYLQRILFNFDSGIFYKILRKKLGIIYYIGLAVNTDNYNADMSYYRIISRCQHKNMPLFIKSIIDILECYELKDEHLDTAKNYFKYYYENKKFYNLTSFNDDYKSQLLFHKDIVKNKDIYKKLLSITTSRIKEYYKNVFVKDILSKHILFYYSNRNSNKAIEPIYKKLLPSANYKTYYIA